MKLSREMQLDLESIRDEFLVFRKRNPPRSRVPQKLRQGVLKLVRSCVPKSRAAAILGLTASQIAVWERGLDRAAGKVMPIEPRILQSAVSPRQLGLRFLVKREESSLNFHFNVEDLGNAPFADSPGVGSTASHGFQKKI